MSELFEPACRRMEWLDPFYKAVWEKAYAEAIPISGTFELTPRCNFNCRMCYVHLKPDEIPNFGRELTAKEWIRIGQEAKDAGTTWLCITGGEPLLHPEFETIYKELSQMGFFITLQTNASLISGKMEKLLYAYPPRGAKITLYGSDNEVYDQVCGVKDGFTKADAGIRALKEMKIPVQLISTVIRQNEKDLPGMAAYALKNELPWMYTGSVKGSYRNTDCEASKVRVASEEEAVKAELRRRLEGKPFDSTRKPCTLCRDYRLGYWVTWNGDMRFCSFMKEPQIPVRELSFADAWQALIRYEEELDWPEECKTCEVQGVCRKCAGSLAAECGSPHQVTEAFCNRVKKYYDKERKEWKIWE